MNITEKYYKISEDELKELLYAMHKLSILEIDGVDNWTWYMEGREEYVKSYCEENDIPLVVDEDGDIELPDFTELAEWDLRYYDEIKD